MMFREEIKLNFTMVNNVTVYIVSGFKKSNAVTTHTITSPEEVLVAVYNKTYIIAVPTLGATFTEL